MCVEPLPQLLRVSRSNDRPDVAEFLTIAENELNGLLAGLNTEVDVAELLDRLPKFLPAILDSRIKVESCLVGGECRGVHATKVACVGERGINQRGHGRRHPGGQLAERGSQLCVAVQEM